PAEVRVDDARVREGDADTTYVTFVVRVTRPPESLDFALRYETAPRTATADVDYVSTQGEIWVGDSVLTIPVAIVGDTRLEGNETFELRLSTDWTPVTIVDGVGVGTLENDERTSFTRTSAGLWPQHMIAPAFTDLDGDLDPDLGLDLNVGGVFTLNFGMYEEIAQHQFHGTAWCDYDRDGRADLMLTPYSHEWEPPIAAHLLRSTAPGQFLDVAPFLGMSVVGHCETVVWGDFNGDHWPDLYTPYYTYQTPFRSFFYLNRGDGTFEETAVEAGVALIGVPESLKPEGASAVDWNDDGTLDLFVASHLFLNDGTAHFTDVREQVGLPALFEEGAQFVDADNDGDFDLWIRAIEGPRLFRNDKGHFVDVTVECGFPWRPFHWGGSWADVDNDGDIDLMFASPPGINELYLNHGDGTFEPDTAFAAAGLAGSLSAWADVDRDGDLDAVVDSPETGLFTNHLERLVGIGPIALRVWVMDEMGLPVSFGATARLRELDGGPNTTQSRIVDGGSGYL